MRLGLPTISQNNRAYFLAYFSLAGVLGSIFTIGFAAITVWAILSLALRRFPLAYKRDDLPLLFACAIALMVNFLVAVYHAASASDLFESASWLLLLGPLVLIPRYRASPEVGYRELMFKGAMAGSALAFAIALLQLLIGMRAEGGTGNALPFATITALLGAISLVGAVEAKDSRGKLVALACSAAAVVAVGLSGSRMPLVSALLVYAVLFVVNRDAFKLPGLNITKALVAGGVFATFLGAFLLAVFADRAMDERRLQELGLVGSANYRVLYVQIGTELFADAPLLGHGRNNREDVMTAALEARGVEPVASQGKRLVSWHRFLPVKLRAHYVSWRLEAWRNERAREVSDAQARGAPIPPPKPRPLPVYEDVEPTVLQHTHLHNEYLTNVVDGGVVSLAAYLTLLALPLAGAVFFRQWRTDRVAFSVLLATTMIVALTALTNVSLENDVIFVGFLSCLIAARLISKPQMNVNGQKGQRTVS